LEITMSIMLHCGSQPMSRVELALVPTPPPMGNRHHPYPYIDYVEQVGNALQACGFKLISETFGVNRQGAQFFGLMEVLPWNRPDDAGYSRLIGLRGSHDQSLPRGLAAGSRVFVCDNLCFSGEVTVNTRQTTYVERRMPGLVLNAVRNLAGAFEVQDARYDRYRSFELKPRWGDAAIVELMRRGVIGPSHMARVVREWDEPSHAEHAENGHSVWRLMNAVTEVLKPALDDNGIPTRATAPSTIGRTVRMTQFLDEVAGFTPELAKAA
jgi:hypothetical protein